MRKKKKKGLTPEGLRSEKVISHRFDALGILALTIRDGHKQILQNVAAWEMGKLRLEIDQLGAVGAANVDHEDGLRIGLQVGGAQGEAGGMALMPQALFMQPSLAHPQIEAVSQVGLLLEELPDGLALRKLIGTQGGSIPRSTERRGGHKAADVGGDRIDNFSPLERPFPAWPHQEGGEFVRAVRRFVRFVAEEERRRNPHKPCCAWCDDEPFSLLSLDRRSRTHTDHQLAATGRCCKVGGGCGRSLFRDQSVQNAHFQQHDNGHIFNRLSTVRITR